MGPLEGQSPVLSCISLSCSTPPPILSYPVLPCILLYFTFLSPLPHFGWMLQTPCRLPATCWLLAPFSFLLPLDSADFLPHRWTQWWVFARRHKVRHQGSQVETHPVLPFLSPLCMNFLLVSECNLAALQVVAEWRKAQSVSYGSESVYDGNMSPRRAQVTLVNF